MNVTIDVCLFGCFVWVVCACRRLRACLLIDLFTGLLMVFLFCVVGVLGFVVCGWCCCMVWLVYLVVLDLAVIGCICFGLGVVF